MITIEKCPCGHPSCHDYHLVGIGKFVQGSGFTKDEAETIAALLNDRPLLPRLSDTTLSLKMLFDTQAELQDRMGWPTGTGEDGLKENLLHVFVESVEALMEVNFKPWKSVHKEVDRSALATELTDILQFWANAALAMDFTPEELTWALCNKWQVNHQRIDAGSVVKGDGNE